MFERYTKKGGRAIFFARYEAVQFGSPDIESEHLLLGLLREDKALVDMFLHSDGAVESIRKQVEGQTGFREKVSTLADFPMSNECKRILAYAAEEADEVTHKFIGTTHLLLGVLREQDSVLARLQSLCARFPSAIPKPFASSFPEFPYSRFPKPVRLSQEA